MKRLLLLLPPVTLAMLGGWLLATESGLQIAVHAAQSLTDGRLRMTGASGRLLDVIGFDEVVYDHPASTVTLRDVRLNLRLSRLLLSRVQAESLSASSLQVTTHLREVPAKGEPISVRMPLRIAVERGDIGRFELSLRDGARHWSLSKLEFAARWRDEWIVIGKASAVTQEAGAVAVRGRVAIVEDRLLLDGVQIEGPAEFQASGALAITDAAVNELELKWQVLDWSGLRPLRSESGRARLDGRWPAYGWTLNANVDAADIQGKLVASGRGSLDRLDVQRLQLALLGGEVRGKGQVAWSDGLRTTATLQLDRINPGQRFEQWPGIISGAANFSGDWHGAVPDLKFDAQLRDSQLRGYPLTLAVRGTTDQRRVILQELTLDSGPSRLRAQGRLLPELDLTGDLASPDLQSLLAGLSGSVALKFGLKGDPFAPRLSTRGSGANLAFKLASGSALRAAQASWSASLSESEASDLQVELKDAELGLPLDRVQLEGRGTVLRHRLRLEATAASGSASLNVDGGFQRAAWWGQVADADLQPVGESSWHQQLDSNVKVALPDWSMELLCLQRGASRVCAEGQATATGLRGAAEVVDFDFENLRHWLPGEWTLAGKLDGTASVRVRGSEVIDLRANLAATAGYLDAAGVHLEFGPSSVGLEPEGDRLHAHLRLQPAGGLIEGDVWLEPGALLLDRPLSGHLQASLPDLSWLPVLSTEISSASGALESQLTLSGTPRSPALQGRLAIAQARVQLATPGIELTDITAVFESGQQLPLSISVNAKSGGGTLKLEGGIERLRPTLVGKFTLTGENAQWANTPDIRAWVSPNLELVLAGPDSRLTGEIRVPRAAITPRDLSSGGVGPSGDQVLVESDVATSGRALRLESQVRIELGDQVRFDGLGLKTRLEGAIDANDKPGRLTRGFGELRLVGGRYKAYGQDLTIETGRLLFNGGPVSEPGIELSAYRQPDEAIRVGLRARGPLSAPSFSLYSDPAMTQEEQLSWLVLGRPLTETLQSGQRPELDSAATSLGFAGGEYLAQQLAPKVGLDEVSVGARPGETAEQARLTIGKYLSPRLFVSYGFALFQPGQFVRLQYELGRGFKLRGESGVEQGGDLIYTFER